jgi:hypothetical protein
MIKMRFPQSPQTPFSSPIGRSAIRVRKAWSRVRLVPVGRAALDLREKLLDGCPPGFLFGSLLPQPGVLLPQLLGFALDLQDFALELLHSQLVLYLALLVMNLALLEMQHLLFVVGIPTPIEHRQELSPARQR